MDGYVFHGWTCLETCLNVAQQPHPIGAARLGGVNLRAEPVG